MTGLYTRKKYGSTTVTRNNKTGRTSVTTSMKLPGGKTKTKNMLTGRTTVRQTRKG